MHLANLINNNMSLFLRLISAGIKFSFVLFLGAYSTDSTMASYAIVMSVIAITTQLFGCEINVVISRNMHRESIDKNKLIFQQYISYIAIYILFFSPLYFVYASYLNISLFYIFALCFITMFEHFFTEVFRTYVSLIQVKKATLIQFLKSSPYIIFIVLLFYLSNKAITIEMIIIALLVNHIFIFFFIFAKNFSCIKVLRDVYTNKVGPKTSIIGYLIESLPYYIVSIASILCLNLDKLILSKYINEQSLSEYYQVFVICSIISLLISFTVGVKQGPIMIKDYTSNNCNDYAQKRKALLYLYLKYSMSFGLIVFIACLSYLYVKYGFSHSQLYMVCFVMVITNVLNAISQVLKLDLFLKNRDKTIAAIYTLSLVLFLVVSFYLVGRIGMLGAALANLSAALTVLSIMTYKVLNEKSSRNYN